VSVRVGGFRRIGIKRCGDLSLFCLCGYVCDVRDGIWIWWRLRWRCRVCDGTGEWLVFLVPNLGLVHLVRVSEEG
jgi:hypothetical protein